MLFLTGLFIGGLLGVVINLLQKSPNTLHNEWFIYTLLFLFLVGGAVSGVVFE